MNVIKRLLMEMKKTHYILNAIHMNYTKTIIHALRETYFLLKIQSAGTLEYTVPLLDVRPFLPYIGVIKVNANSNLANLS